MIHLWLKFTKACRRYCQLTENNNHDNQNIIIVITYFNLEKFQVRQKVQPDLCPHLSLNWSNCIRKAHFITTSRTLISHRQFSVLEYDHIVHLLTRDPLNTKSLWSDKFHHITSIFIFMYVFYRCIFISGSRVFCLQSC